MISIKIDVTAESGADFYAIAARKTEAHGLCACACMLARALFHLVRKSADAHNPPGKQCELAGAAGVWKQNVLMLGNIVRMRPCCTRQRAPMCL